MSDASDASDVSDVDEQDVAAAPEVNLAGGAVLAALFGAALCWTARTGAVPLLIGVAALQALLAFAWVYVLRVPGRRGGIVIAALAAAGSDVAASLWPHSRLAAMLAVLGLAVPAMFVHQLLRGAARVRVAESFGAIALLVLAEAALPALLQLRHEFPRTHLGADPTFAVIAVSALALLGALFTDMTLPVPRFDDEVPRGLPALVVAVVVGAAAGHLALRELRDFANGRAAFVGAAIGVVVALLAVAVAYIERGVPTAESGFARRSRPVLTVLVPFALAAPVGLVLCLAIRT